MPLFHPRVIEKNLRSVQPLPASHAAILKTWAENLQNGTFNRETSHDGEFIQRILIEVLGYTGSSAGPEWTVAKNQPVGSGNVDVALGHFSAARTEIIAPFELKGAKTRDLDAVMPGRNKSPVQQAWEYAMDAKGAKWVLVSNYREIRLYAVGYGRKEYEAFDLATLHTNPVAYARFMVLLSAKQLLSGETASLLKASEEQDKDITNRLYRDYKALRAEMIRALTASNPGVLELDVIRFTQTILDRVLFVAFAEDRGLLPKGVLQRCYDERNAWNPQPAWENFKGLFRAIDVGNPPLNIPGYNGGLFAADPGIDALHVPDGICEGFKALGAYDFDSEVSVNILGHIFEQSITDLEEIKASLGGEVFDRKASKRKKDGVFYTPPAVTRFIVEQAVGGWLAERKRELGFDQLPVLTEADYASIQQVTRGKRKGSFDYNAKIAAHREAWEAYRKVLSHIRVVDPACGSGAFLNEVFDFLYREGQQVNSNLTQLNGGQIELFRWDAHILANNLFGVDLNRESVEITKLSLWLKTARRDEKLTYLDGNIRCGNSLIDDPAVAEEEAFDWRAAFPEVMQEGGFDVVVGNPPYVRMEHLKPVKPWLEARYAVASDRADLYCYFYELGLKVLKRGGKLGFISSNTFFRTGSGQPLRRHLLAAARLETIIDFGDVQIFEGATTYPAIVIFCKDTAPAAHALHYLGFRTAPESDLANLMERQAVAVPQSRLTEASWTLEDDAPARIRQKITAGKPTLKEVYGSPCRGVVSGCNEAFVVDRATRDRLIQDDPKAADLLKPFLEGKDLKPWHVAPRDLWLIYIPKNRINIDDYPSIKTHLLPYREALEKRATKQAWFELQQAQEAYKPYFEGTKILYPEFNDEPNVSINNGFYCNNKCYFLNTEDVFLAALLRSKVWWFLLKPICTPVSGGYLQFHGQFIETLPIPQIIPEQKATLADFARQCQDTAETLFRLRQKFLSLLTAEFAFDKPGAKLEQWHTLTPATFLAELAKRKITLTVSQKAEWLDHFTTQKATADTLKSTLITTEADINRIVYQLYNLTAEEIAVVEANVGF